jgi:ankyrin repeat protein
MRESGGHQSLLNNIKGRSLEVAQVLLRHGIDVNAKNPDNWTALHYASQNRDIELCRVLLTGNADALARTNGGHTVAHIAAAVGALDVLRLLSTSELDFESIDELGMTPAHWAVLSENADAVAWLIDRTDCDLRDRSGSTGLHWAAQEGSIEVLEVLLKAGADPNISDDGGRAPLHRTIMPQIVPRRPRYPRLPELPEPTIIENGDFIYVGPPYAGLTWAEARVLKRAEGVRLLVSYGADWDKTDRSGLSARELALQHGEDEITAVFDSIAHGRRIRQIALILSLVFVTSASLFFARRHFGSLPEDSSSKNRGFE